MNKVAIGILACVVLFAACGEKQKSSLNTNDVGIIHANEKQLTEVIIHDIFSPPVAARIYAYTSLAQYEALRYLNDSNPSIAAKMKGFAAMPVPESGKQYDFMLAATRAFCEVAAKIRVFDNEGALKKYKDSISSVFEDHLEKDVYANSIAFGDKIAAVILARAATDQYKQTRGMPKFLGKKDDGFWQPTAPDYFDATEPHWHKLKPFSLDTCSQFRPMKPLQFAKDSVSAYYGQIKEVYHTGKFLTPEQRQIAKYWDDNPFVMEHAGHTMFANKKITPGGHWMGIAAIASRKANADAVKTAKTYALTAIALLDGFIACWDAKFQYQTVRPITLINQWMDKTWEPLLQTPPFPDYISGHSTISGAASTVLTDLYGDNFSFHDDSDKEYIGMTRDFPSFNKAAEEASLSRLYGGIHYRMSLDSGLVVGRRVGEHLLNIVQN